MITSSFVKACCFSITKTYLPYYQSHNEILGFFPVLPLLASLVGGQTPRGSRRIDINKTAPVRGGAVSDGQIVQGGDDRNAGSDVSVLIGGASAIINVTVTENALSLLEAHNLWFANHLLPSFLIPVVFPFPFTRKDTRPRLAH